MNEEIKIGDEVICINRDGSSYLKKGETYIVHDISRNKNDILVASVVFCDLYWYSKCLFIKKNIEQNVIELW